MFDVTIFKVQNLTFWEFNFKKRNLIKTILNELFKQQKQENFSWILMLDLAQ